MKWARLKIPPALPESIKISFAATSIRPVTSNSKSDVLEQDVGEHRRALFTTILEHAFQTVEITQECDKIAQIRLLVF
jgi:hypothetical protein